MTSKRADFVADHRRRYSRLRSCPAARSVPNYTRPAAPASEQYDQQAEKQLSAAGGLTNAQHISPGQKINGDWWSAFASAKLDQVMHQAIDGNFDLAAADATIAQANEAVVGAKGGLYPQIDYGGRAWPCTGECGRPYSSRPPPATMQLGRWLVSISMFLAARSD